MNSKSSRPDQLEATNDRDFARWRRNWNRQYIRDDRITNASLIKLMDAVMWELRSGRRYADVGYRVLAKTIGKSIARVRQLIKQIEQLGHWRVEDGRGSAPSDPGQRTRFWPIVGGDVAVPET